uniref:Ig-like domain-containing protein n=1 Tax=Astatotilapia calliptera TaxID=8154 RepID=A0A3P8P4X6_ASTCA
LRCCRLYYEPQYRKVEGNTEAESVQLPCQHSGFIPDDNPTVTWTRNDLDPTTVHLRREEGDDLKGQNRRYSRRTSMRPDALDSLDFSLTLRKPQLTDSGKYSCTLSDGRKERTLTDVQLQVKGQPQTSTPIIPGQRSILFRGLCLFILLYSTHNIIFCFLSFLQSCWFFFREIQNVLHAEKQL